MEPPSPFFIRKTTTASKELNMMTKINSKEMKKGFTLIELMIVVVIIGILAAMALPRFMRVAAKSKQTEAKGILKQIYTMQEAYFSANESYCLNGVTASALAPVAYAQIHVEVMLPARYSYVMTIPSHNRFVCTATANIDDDATVDTWTIDDTGALINTVDDVSLP
jgi:prepilin-type N-terminal cleavage/methylation domain-containing protein